MRRRHAYLLMFAVPAFLAALLFSIAFFAILASVFWAFIFGDNTWPDYAERTLIALPIAAFILIWGGLLKIAYDTGRREEEKPALNRRHAAMAGGVTAAMLALVFAFQQAMHTLNPPSAESACADLCRGKGFGGSVMPPRNTGSNECTCIDSEGRHALTTELPTTGPRR